MGSSSSEKKGGKLSKKERRFLRKKMLKFVPYEWEKWGLHLPPGVEGDPSAFLNAAELRVVEKRCSIFDVSQKW